jgi:hypothetical protein
MGWSEAWPGGKGSFVRSRDSASSGRSSDFSCLGRPGAFLAGLDRRLGIEIRIFIRRDILQHQLGYLNGIVAKACFG